VKASEGVGVIAVNADILLWSRTTTRRWELLAWAEHNRQDPARHTLYATGTTGTLLEYELGPAR
jgi:methylglyoxal synthase